MSEFEEMNEQATPQGKKRKGKKLGMGMLLILLLAIGFVAFLLWAIIAGDGNGNVFLFFSGLIDLLIAFILFKVYVHQERYICPECGCKREHHREHIRTTDKITDDSVSEKITYTHHYEDSYVCPDCGCTQKENCVKSGGYIQRYKNTGTLKDCRTTPREF